MAAMAASALREFTYPADKAKVKLIKKKTVRFTFMGHATTVNTYTVHPTNAAGKILRGGPDDNTLKDPELADLVRRGCSDLFIDGTLVAQVRGPAKFFGTEDEIDEDDLPYDGAEEKDFAAFTSVRQHTDATIAKWNAAGELRTDFWEKANGKFAIATLFILDGKLCVFGGSKNVHVPVELDVDLTTLPNELHFNIMLAVIQDIRSCHPRILESLVGRQIIGEYCDGKHVVYTPTSYMVYFDETLPASFRKPMRILPSVTGVPSDEILTKLRKLVEIEGVVVYYVNTVTGEIIRRKHKTVWYVLIRCWREIVRKYTKGMISTDALTGLLTARMHSRSDQFLHLSVEELQEWKKTAATFVERLTKSKYAYADVNPFSEVGMAKIWYDLMLNPNYTDPETDDGENKNEFASSDVEGTVSFTDILVQPAYYSTVYYAAENKHKVLVIMQGPPGSGKSTVVAELKKFLEHYGHSVEVFSTDSYFMIDGVYQFGPKKLGVNHAKNLAAASASAARVVIVDNTNLSPGEYAKYKANMLDRVVIVLSCKVDSPEALVRNTHGVPLDALKKMCAKYTPAAPAYIGGFVSHDDLKEFAADIKQIQPSHLTELFVGGDYRKLKDFDFSALCKLYPFEITGVSRSAAGVGLVCKAEIRSESTPHITLAVNEGSKAVDVGKQIAPANTTVIEPPLVRQAIRLPMF